MIVFWCRWCWWDQTLPSRERWSSLLLSGSIHVDHCEVLGDLLHVLKVEKHVEARLVCNQTAIPRANATIRQGIKEVK